MGRTERQGILSGCSTDLEKLRGHFQDGGALVDNTELKKRFEHASSELARCADAKGQIKDVIGRDRLKEIRHEVGVLTTDCNRVISRARRSPNSQHISQSA